MKFLNQFIGNQYLKSLQWGTIMIAINFVKQILLVPILISILGQYDYALWILLTAISILIRALNLGLLNYNSNIINLSFYTKIDLNIVLVEARNSIVFLGIIQIIISIIISFPFVISVFIENEFIAHRSYQISYSLVFLSVANIIYQYSSLFYLRLLEPIGKINLTIKFQAIGELMDFLVTLIVFFIFKSIFITAISILLFYCIYSLFIIRLVKRESQFRMEKFELKISNALHSIKKSMILTFSFLIEKLYESGLNLVVSKFYSVAVLPMFTTTRIVANSSLRSSTILVTPIMPSIQMEFSLNKPDLIVQRMIHYWQFSGSVLILVTMCLFPFLYYLFNLWTINLVTFNHNLFIFLFIAIALQNFALVLVEFLKKTNQNKQLLGYNIIKVSITLACIYLSSFSSLLSSIGLGLVIGEAFGICYLINRLNDMILKSVHRNNILRILSHLIIYSLGLIFFIDKFSYFLFLTLGVASIIILIYPQLRKIFK